MVHFTFIPAVVLPFAARLSAETGAPEASTGLHALGAAVLIGAAMLAVGLGVGRLLFLVLKGEPVHAVFPATALLVMALAAPVPAWTADAERAYGALLVMLVGACAFGYFVFRNRMAPRTWALPLVILIGGAWLAFG